MALARRSRVPRPSDMYDGLKHAKPRREKGEQMDTRGMQSPKIHPDRNEEYKRWLYFQPCAIKGLTDSATGQPHVCWSPQEIGYGRPQSDPAHSSRAGLGLKASDSQCIPLCRHAHRLSEGQENRFDARFGIDRYAVAAEHFARFTAERERGR